VFPVHTNKINLLTLYHPNKYYIVEKLTIKHKKNKIYKINKITEKNKNEFVGS